MRPLISDMDEDEDSRLFLSMLDAAAESIFQACSQIMAAESSDISVACDIETVQQSTSSPQQDNELCSELNPMNAPPPPAVQAGSFPGKPRKRRKRSWTSDQCVQQQPFPARKTNFSGNEITLASVGWPQQFSSTSNVFGKPLNGFRAKETFTFAKNFNRHQRKRAVRSNVGPVQSAVDDFLPGALLPPITGNDGKCETEDTEKFDDFSKEIHEAIDRIESLIPSLQKLVNCVQTPIDQKTVGNVELRNTYGSICQNDQVNRLGVAEIRQVTGNDAANTNKYAEDVNQEGKYPISFALKQNSAFCAKGNAKVLGKEFKGQKETVNQTMNVIPTNFTSTVSNGQVRLVGFERSSQPKSRVHEHTAHLPMDRVESLTQTLSRNESVTSHTSEYFQGLRKTPCQRSRNIFDNQKQTNKHASRKDARSRFRDSSPSIGSSSVRRTNRIISTDKYGHARKRTAHFEDSNHRSSIRRKSMNEASESKFTRKDQVSEETSWSSSASFSGASTDTCNSGTDESYTYSSENDESPLDLSERTGDYETTSANISEDQDSDTGASRQRSLDQSYTLGNHLEKRIKLGRMSKLRKKLGMVFHHHHHHHHHHYSDSDDTDFGHVGLLKRLGKMFRRRGKTDSQEHKAEKSRKPVTKSVVKKKQYAGHFRALIDGLIRHMRHSKKSKNVKDDIERLGSGRHRGRTGKNILFRLPKMGRDRVKVGNKGKVKLRRVDTRAKRPLLLR